MRSTDELAGELRDATNAVTLIERRDDRAWPVAEVLVTMWRDGCLRRLVTSMAPDEVFTPTTDGDLVELFGEPVTGFEQPNAAPNAVREVGALAAWHGELRRGVGGQRADQPATWRSSYRDHTGEWTDPLRAAAAREAEGREFDRMGLRYIGDRCRLDAARIMATAAKRGAA